MAEARVEKAAPEFDAGAFLAKHSGQVFDSGGLLAALSKAGSVVPAVRAREFFEKGKIQSLGNVHEGGEPGKVFRFKVCPCLPGGEVWVRTRKGYAAGVVVAGLRLDTFGQLVELTSETRTALEAPDVPVEVISKPERIKRLVARAQKRAAAAQEAVDKRANTLEAFG